MADGFPVGVDVERRATRSPWCDHVWRAVGLRPPEPALSEWTLLAESGMASRYYAGTAEITLHRGDTKNYRENLEARSPSAYVILRPTLREGASITGLDLWGATVDPAEAHAHADVGDDIVDALPMPPALREWVACFVARHHVERPAWKRRREDGAREPRRMRGETPHEQ